MKKYYKLVTHDLKSWIVSNDRYIKKVGEYDLSIQYKLNEWVCPNIPESKLMVFSDLIIANFYFNANDKLFEVDVINPTTGLKIVNVCNLYSTNNKVMPLKQYERLHDENMYPVSTVFCDAVMLKKEIR